MNFELDTQFKKDMIGHIVKELNEVWEECGTPKQNYNGPITKARMPDDLYWSEYDYDDIPWMTVYNNLVDDLLRFIDVRNTSSSITRPMWYTQAFGDPDWNTRRNADDELVPGYNERGIEIIVNSLDALLKDVCKISSIRAFELIDEEPTIITDLPRSILRIIIHNPETFYVHIHDAVLLIEDESYPDEDKIIKIIRELGLEQEKETMSKIPVYDEDETIVANVNSNACLDSWDGHNWTSGSTGQHLGLTQLKKSKKFVLIHTSQWEGSREHGEIVSPEAALQAILRSGNTEILDKYPELKALQADTIEEEEV